MSGTKGVGLIVELVVGLIVGLTVGISVAAGLVSVGINSSVALGAMVGARLGMAVWLGDGILQAEIINNVSVTTRIIFAFDAYLANIFILSVILGSSIKMILKIRLIVLRGNKFIKTSMSN